MVQRAGHKISPQSVVGIRELPDGRIVWLENGNERSGLTHILGEYGDQFRQLGVGDDRLPGFLLDTLERGKVLGFQGTGTGRPIYEGIIGEQRVRVSITVGENGYIVGANYAGRVRRP